VDKGSPYQEWHPDSLGWLHRKAKDREPVLPHDVARIVAANPDLVADDVLRDHIIGGLNGQLIGRRGRNRRTPMHMLRLHLAAHQLDVLTRWYKRAHKRGYAYASDHKRAGLGLTEFLHERIARRLKLGSGRSLANSLSSLKRRPY